MFGYVMIDKPELKVKDYYKYKAYYCGLCRMLKERYGFLGQMTLTYDMTFAIVLLTSLYESETTLSKHHCIVHPVQKHEMLQNEITEYTAAMNVILACYHFEDDWKDDKSLPGLAGSTLLNRKVRNIIRQYPVQSDAIWNSLRQLQQYEAEQSTDIDLVSGCFGKLMEELFLYRKDHWEPTLRRLGFYLGKFIYLMDAYEDLPEDLKGNHYNPLRVICEQEDYEERCYQMMLMMMGECSAEFEKLPCLLDADILRNILYSGVWAKYNKIQKKRKEEKEQDNDNRSL